MKAETNLTINQTRDSSSAATLPASSPPELPTHTGAEMGILEHLRELRQRLIYISLIVVVSTAISYNFVEQIFAWLCEPFHSSFPGQNLIGTGPAEAFMIKLKVALFAGFILGLPLIAQQIWNFVRPALYDDEKKMIIPVAAIATLLFLGGVLFCYYLVLPLAFSFFFSQYSSISLEPNIKISDQLSTSLNMMTAFGATFEMPLIVYVLASLGIITDATLIAVSRYAIVFIFVAAAVLTPPDVVSQILMAAPLLILYAISIWIAKRVTLKRKA